MRKSKADEIGPPPDSHSCGQSDERSGQRSSAERMDATRRGDEQTHVAAASSAASAPTEPGASITGSVTATPAAAAAVRPFSRLALVELQLIMRCCDKSTLLALAHCSRFTLTAASHPFVWQPLSPISLKCDWPLELSGRLRAPKSLLRHADICVSWRLLAASASVQQVAALAALPRLRGVSFETIWDPVVKDYNDLSDEAAALLFEALRDRIDHGGALMSLSIFGGMIGQAGGAELAAFIQRSRSLTSLKVTGASKFPLPTLAAALTKSRTLTRLELQSADPSMETVRALASFVQQSTSLATLRLYRFQLDDAAAATLAAAVAHSRSLVDLQLQFCALGDAGVEALADALEQSSYIRALDFSDNNFGAAGTAALVRLLCSDRCALTSLNVSHNWIGDEGALALADALLTNCTLTELRLSDICCGAEGIRVLLTALQHNPQCFLRVLDLSWNPLSASCASSLAEVIDFSWTLERLDLRSCNLGNEGMAALAAGIGRSRSLQRLDLYGNLLGVPGAAALAAAIATCPTLTSLEMSGNKIGDAGLAALVPALFNVRRLDLRECGLTQSSAKPLAQLIQRSRVLESLDVSSNQLDARGVAEIAAALQPSSSLRTLDLQSESGIGVQGTAALAATLSRGWKASKLWLSQGEPTDDSGALALAAVMERLGSRCTLTSLSLSGRGMTVVGALSVVQAATQAPRLRELRLHFVRDDVSVADRVRLLIAACGPQPHFELKITPLF